METGFNLHCQLYLQFWRKARRELERYHRGRGLSILEAVKSHPGDLFSCLCHSRRMKLALQGHGEKWTEKLERRFSSWEKVFDSLLSLYDEDVSDQVDSVLAGSVGIREVVSYAR